MYRTVVVGSGVAALVAAFVAADRGRVLLLVRLGFAKAIPLRVDSMPAGALAGLIDLGLDPRLFSDLRRHGERVVAWSSAEPQVRPSADTVHVERGPLEAALFARLVHHPRVTLMPAPTRKDALLGLAERHERAGSVVIDATGRAARLATRRSALAEPWYAWTWHARAARGESFDGGLRLVALPDGYCYALGTASAVTFGFVTPHAGRSPDPAERFERLCTDLPWLFEGAARFGAGARFDVYDAGLQVAEHGGRVAVGDAALGRDALSSQGLASAISDARHAAAVEGPEDVRLYADRAEEQTRRHVTSLAGILAECLFAASPAWSRYLGELGAREPGERVTPAPVALRGGRLMRIPPAPAPPPA